MIIKGSARGQSASDTQRLADHILDVRGNERVTVLGLRGVGSGTLPDALDEMRAISLATRTRRPLYHASISPDADEARRMTPRHWVEAADELEQALALCADHQRVLVLHTKRGRTHLHVVWSRVHPETLKVPHDGWSYVHHEQCARTLESRWRLRRVIGAHIRPPGFERPRAAKNHREHQSEVRTGIPVSKVADTLRRCWDASADGRGFAVAVRLAGLDLVRGRRGVVAVDSAGVPHSLARRLGLTADVVRQKLADLDITRLPTVDDAKATDKQPSPRRIITMPKPTREFAAASQVRRPRTLPCPVDPNYWTALGYAVEPVAGFLLVTLSGNLVLEDRGDELIIRGTPTPDATSAMVTAAKARGWQGIHFSGDEVWQRQAKIEAIRQGFDPARITLECEKNKPWAAAPMPEHVRRRIAPPPAEPDPASETPDPTLPEPAAPVPAYLP